MSTCEACLFSYVFGHAMLVFLAAKGLRRLTVKQHFTLNWSAIFDSSRDTFPVLLSLKSSFSINDKGKIKYTVRITLVAT
jgi:hypothetical protein